VPGRLLPRNGKVLLRFNEHGGDAAVPRHRLEYRGQSHVRQRRPQVRVIVEHGGTRAWHSRRAQRGALQVLPSQQVRGIRRVEGKPQPFGGVGRFAKDALALREHAIGAPGPRHPYRRIRHLLRLPDHGQLAGSGQSSFLFPCVLGRRGSEAYCAQLRQRGQRPHVVGGRGAAVPATLSRGSGRCHTPARRPGTLRAAMGVSAPSRCLAAIPAWGAGMQPGLVSRSETRSHTVSWGFAAG
jgi:hypothetical protein